MKVLILDAGKQRAQTMHYVLAPARNE